MKKLQELFSHLRWKVELFFLNQSILSYIVALLLIALFLIVWLSALCLVTRVCWGWIFSL